MEFLMKSYEYRVYPMGDVYRIKVDSLEELKQIIRLQEMEDGKRTGSAHFKKEDESDWLTYEEFVVKHFWTELRLQEFDYENNKKLIGFEDENGNFESYEKPAEETEELLKILEGFEESGAADIFKGEYYEIYDSLEEGETNITLDSYLMEKAYYVYESRAEKEQIRRGLEGTTPRSISSETSFPNF